MIKRQEPVWKRILETVRVHSSETCAVEGCDKPRGLRQFCGMHYARLKAAGEHPKDEPRFKSSASHYEFVDLLSMHTDECVDWDGYVVSGYPGLAFKGKNYRVNRLVCEAFRGPAPSDKHEAAHECGRSICCNWRHLSWKTHRENIGDKRVHGTLPIGERHHAAKLTEDSVRSIRQMRHQKTRRELASQFGVGRSTLDNVLDGVTWRHVS